MTNYNSSTPPLGWSNSYSVAFVDLLTMCAAARLVPERVHWTFGFGDNTVRASSGTRAGVDNVAGWASQLMTRELVARVNTGQLLINASYDPLLEQGTRYGTRWADEYLRAAEVPYRLMSGGVVRSSEAVLRHGVSDPPSYVQVEAIEGYRTKLAAVLAEHVELKALLAEQAAVNLAANPESAAVIAAELVDARARYVALLQAAYPDRGYA